MRNIIASVCVIALLPTGIFAQAPGEPTPTPASPPRSPSIASAIAALRFVAPTDREGSRTEGDAVAGVAGGVGLGAAPVARRFVADQEPNQVSDWSRAQALQRGIEITLTVKGSPAAKVQLLVASDSAVFVLKPTGPGLPGRVKAVLVGIGDQWPRIFNGGAVDFEAEGVRVARDGVFDGTRKVADLAQVPREDISEIRGPGRRKGNKLLAGVGAAGGFLLGAFIGIGLASKDCGGSCSDEKFLIGLSVIGLPTALGVLGYYGGGHTVGGMIIYRASPSA